MVKDWRQETRQSGGLTLNLGPDPQMGKSKHKHDLRQIQDPIAYRRARRGRPQTHSDHVRHRKGLGARAVRAQAPPLALAAQNMV